MENLNIFTNSVLGNHFSNGLLARVIPVLKDVENSVEAGKKNGLWFPHGSVEGGTPTIAYGHKIPKHTTMEIFDGVCFDYANGLTEEQALVLLRSDLCRALRKARVQLQTTYPNQRSSKIMNNEKYMMILTLIVFNVGSLQSIGGDWGWPSLIQAMLNDDLEGIRKEMVTSYRDPSGRRHRLTKRADALFKAVFPQHKKPLKKKILSFLPWR